MLIFQRGNVTQRKFMMISTSTDVGFDQKEEQKQKKAFKYFKDDHRELSDWI